MLPLTMIDDPNDLWQREVTSSFNQDRWDYYYSVRHNSDTKIAHHITILFAEGRVVAIENQIEE